MTHGFHDSVQSNVIGRITITLDWGGGLDNDKSISMT